MLGLGGADTAHLLQSLLLLNVGGAGFVADVDKMEEEGMPGR